MISCGLRQQNKARAWFPGQHFHLYLIAYGIFRFFHEFMRATPKPFGGVSGYHIIALLTAVAAAVAYRKRAQAPAPCAPA